MAAKFLDRIDRRASKNWRLHAVGGFMFMTSGNLAEARKEFAKALSLNRVGTEDYPPYFYFLALSGNASEALRLGRKHWNGQIDHIAAHVVYARLLIMAEQFAEARSILENALDMDKGYWEVHYVLALLYTSQGCPNEAAARLEQMRSLANSDMSEVVGELCERLASVSSLAPKE